VALLGLLDRFCFRDSLLLVGQVAFSGRYSFRCGFELFPLYLFVDTFSTVLQVARIPKTVAKAILPTQPPVELRAEGTFVTLAAHLHKKSDATSAPTAASPTPLP